MVEIRHAFTSTVADAPSPPGMVKPSDWNADHVFIMQADRLLGRIGSDGDALELDASQVRGLLNVADGATANSPDAFLLARANHTGTQLAATISDFSTAADARISAAIGVTVQAYSANLAAWSAVNPASYLTIANATASYQPLDSDLTAIAALTTTAYGRGLLTAAGLSSIIGTGAITSGMIADGTIVDADVNSAAAIDDSKLSHNQGGTGSSPISLFNVLKERIRASYFGCDPGASAAVNRAAIQNALNAVSANGGLVLLPSGDINLDGTTINMVARATLQGHNDGTKLITNNASNNMIDVAASWSSIRDLRFDSSVTRTGGYAVRYLPGGGRADLTNFHIENFVNGVYVGNTVSVRISHGRLLSFIAAIGVGIRFDAGLDMKIDDILMDAAAQIFAGIYITACGDLTISRAQMIHAGQGIYCEVGAGAEVDSLWVNDSMFDNCNRGMYMHANGGKIQRTRFADCWFSSAVANEGIRLETASGGAIDGMQIINPHAFLNAQGGIYVADSGVTNLRIVNPEIANNTGAGVKFGANVAKWSIMGGAIGKTGGFASGNSTYGVDLSAGGHDFYQIVGVDLRQNTSGAMTGHVPGANKKRKLNLGIGSNDDGQDVATATNDDAIAGNIGEILSAQSPVFSGTATMTIATPCVVTWAGMTANGKGNWTVPIVFSTTGALPTGVTAGTVYWLIGSTLGAAGANTFQIATSAANAIAGTAIATSGTQSGTHTGSSQQNIATLTSANVAALQLTPGDWDIDATCVWIPANTTVVTQFLDTLSLTSATLDTAPGNAASTLATPITYNGSRGIHLPTPTRRISVAANTNVFLVGYSEFTTAANPVVGGARARRVR